MENVVNDLLEQTKLILEKERWKEQLYPEINFIELLRDISDEVNLHSQIIYTLLNPKNELHKRFGNLFFELLKIKDLDDIEYRVEKEYSNIDILIHTEDKAIIIENKIYSGDQESQLSRYYKKIYQMGKKDIEIIYLTLDGRKPAKYSIKRIGEDKIKLISYEYHILKWIEECISISTEYPSYREFLIQYRNTILKLLGRSNSTMFNEVGQLIKESRDSIEAAKIIAKSYENVKIDIQFEFWKSLEEELLSEYGYEALEYKKYSEELVQKFYRQYRNNRYYGIMCPIGRLEEDSNKSLCLYIEIENYVYWGFTVVEKRKEGFIRETNHMKSYNHLKEEFKNVFQNNLEFLNINGIKLYESKYWIGCFVFSEDVFDFRNFKSEEIMKLVENKGKKKIIKNFAKMINDSVELFMNNIEK